MAGDLLARLGLLLIQAEISRLEKEKAGSEGALTGTSGPAGKSAVKNQRQVNSTPRRRDCKK